jgi:hypothetical protein
MPGDGDDCRALEVLGMVGDPDEMALDGEEINHDESELLETESRDARALDQQLASDLRRRRLGGETSSAGYLRGLGDRPLLPLGVERRLVEASQAGDRRARSS